MHSYRTPSAILALILILCLASCTSSQTVTDLEVALDAISVGLPILGTVSGVPANVITAAEAYLAAANDALGQASAILVGPGTDAQKSALIIAAFASVAQPVIPPQYAAIGQLVNLVATDIAKLIAGLPSPNGIRAQTVLGDPTHKWSSGDLSRIAHAKSVASSNATALAKLRGK